MAEITAQAVKALRDQTGAGMMDCKRVLEDADGDLKRAVELLRERGLAKAGRREGRATSEGVIAIALDGGAGGIVEVGCETDFVARTEDLVSLAERLAALIGADADLATVDALLKSPLDGGSVEEGIQQAIARLGENVVVKRVARLEVEDGVVGGYVHAGGKLGVLVAVSGPGDLADLAKDISMHVAAADPTPVAIDRDGVPAELLASERAIYRKQAQQERKPESVIDRIVEGRLSKFLKEICLLDQAFVKDPDRTVGDLLRRAGEGVGVVAFERFRLGEAGEA